MSVRALGRASVPLPIPWSLLLLSPLALRGGLEEGELAPRGKVKRHSFIFFGMKKNGHRVAILAQVLEVQDFVSTSQTALDFTTQLLAVVFLTTSSWCFLLRGLTLLATACGCRLHKWMRPVGPCVGL